jgi:hypothetical protein
MKFVNALLVAALLASLGASQDDPKAKQAEAKQKDDEAKAKISEFNKARSKCKTDDDWRSAIDALASIQHPKILKELAGLLKAGNDYIKIKVAELIGKYRGERQAMDELLAVLATEASRAKKNKQGDDIGHETSVAMINAIGEVGIRAAASKLTPFFRNQNIEICKAAITCCGRLKDLDSIDHMIKMLQEMEQAMAQAQAPAGTPPPPGALPPGQPAPPNLPPGVNPAAQMQQEQARRKNILEPVIYSAIKEASGLGPFQSASDCARTWAKEKPGLKQKEKEAEKNK